MPGWDESILRESRSENQQNINKLSNYCNGIKQLQDTITRDIAGLIFCVALVLGWNVACMYGHIFLASAFLSSFVVFLIYFVMTAPWQLPWRINTLNGPPTPQESS